MTQTSFTTMDGWNGPYEATVPGDKTTSDGCGSGVNRNRAFERYEIGQEIQIRAVNDSGQTAMWKTTAKARSNNSSYYSTIPIGIRKQLGLTKGDQFSFWVCAVESAGVQVNSITQISVADGTAENLVKWLNQYAEYCEVHDDEQAAQVRDVAAQFSKELNADE